MLPVDQTDQMAICPLLTALMLLHAQTTGHGSDPLPARNEGMGAGIRLQVPAAVAGRD